MIQIEIVPYFSVCPGDCFTERRYLFLSKANWWRFHVKWSSSFVKIGNPVRSYDIKHSVSETLLHLFQQISPSLSCGNSVTEVRVFCFFMFAVLGFWILKRFSLACRLSIFFQIYKENILLDLCGDEWWLILFHVGFPKEFLKSE